MLPGGSGETFYFTRGTVHEAARDIVQKQKEDDAFFVGDVRDIVRKVELWRKCLPRVTPFYAIKTCGDPVIIAVLASLGVNFDCSNTNEMRAILDMGVEPDRIIYAHTMKSTSHMKFAEEHGVTLMTFDCIEELHKVTDKRARLLLRIKADDRGCQISFNRKFGVSVDDARHILETAVALNIKVIGVTFHVGSVYEHPDIFRRTIEMARIVFDIAADIGKPMTVLDLGGGFPGGVRSHHKIIQACEIVQRAIDEHFPVTSGVQIIAEPGQFFCTSAYSLVVRVVGKRRSDVLIDGVSRRHEDVFLNESKDNCISRYMYDFFDMRITPLEEPRERPMDVLTTLWGGTCNPLDRIDSMKPFFDVDVDEWLVMDNMGAYTFSFVCGFNGTGFPTVHYIASPSTIDLVRRTVERSPVRSGYIQPQEALKVRLSRDKQELANGKIYTAL
ncbi:ornithine decarboxylase [Rhipicephalus sanguineus]|uniref:ornithine decarboxylase n=1 Tax=Rhipicephalus sanguineus TaxID=34632 RepID=UPI00189537C5|nr:ornithine decarboxylase [Rhipicephalus sanguineus]